MNYPCCGVPDPPQKSKTCKGFQWIGQSFKYCDRCGLPFWEHEFEERFNPKTITDIFSDDQNWEYHPISPELAEAVRRKWQ